MYDEGISEWSKIPFHPDSNRGCCYFFRCLSHNNKREPQVGLKWDESTKWCFPCVFRILHSSFCWKPVRAAAFLWYVVNFFRVMIYKILCCSSVSVGNSRPTVKFEDKKCVVKWIPWIFQLRSNVQRKYKRNWCKELPICQGMPSNKLSNILLFETPAHFLVLEFTCP